MHHITGNWGTCDSVLTCCGAGLSSVTLVGERRVLLGMSGVLRVLAVLAVLTVRLVLAVGGVRGEVLLGVVGVVRRLTVVVLVVAATAAASRTGRVLVGAGGPSLLAGIAGHSHQTCQGRARTHNISQVRTSRFCNKMDFFLCVKKLLFQITNHG